MSNEFKEVISFQIYNLNESVENEDRHTFKTKEALFEKMIELGHVDEYGVVRFKMNPNITYFGWFIHLYTVSVTGIMPDGREVERIYNFSEPSCHKDGLHKRFLTDY